MRNLCASLMMEPCCAYCRGVAPKHYDDLCVVQYYIDAIVYGRYTDWNLSLANGAINVAYYKPYVIAAIEYCAANDHPMALKMKKALLLI